MLKLQVSFAVMCVGVMVAVRAQDSASTSAGSNGATQRQAAQQQQQQQALPPSLLGLFFPPGFRANLRNNLLQAVSGDKDDKTSQQDAPPVYPQQFLPQGGPQGFNLQIPQFGGQFGQGQAQQAAGGLGANNVFGQQGGGFPYGQQFPNGFGAGSFRQNVNPGQFGGFGFPGAGQQGNPNAGLQSFQQNLPSSQGAFGAVQQGNTQPNAAGLNPVIGFYGGAPNVGYTNLGGGYPQGGGGFAPGGVFGQFGSGFQGAPQSGVGVQGQEGIPSSPQQSLV